jgi:hypothetical protein
VGSREIFGRKFWQPDSVSESLRELGFTKIVQLFIYRRITIATGIRDVSRAVAIENHHIIITIIQPSRENVNFLSKLPHNNNNNIKIWSNFF